MRTQERPATTLSLVDRSKLDAETPARSELKFELRRADVGKLDEILRVNHRRVVFAAEESVVHSIYFDDSRLGSYAESVDGVGLRSKIRLRWYDSPLPENLAFFEVKRRRHELIEKDRYPLTCDRPLGELTYRELIGGLLAALPEAPRELLRARQSPVVLIRYRRRHYHARDRDSPARVTIDHQIVGSGQSGMRRPGIRFPSSLGERVVLEVKAPPGWESSARASLHPLRLRRTRCSKYLMCCDQVGRATGAAYVGS